MSSEQLERELRHLVSLNEPRNGGPYQGVAAERCVSATAKAADTIALLRAPGAIAAPQQPNWHKVATSMRAQRDDYARMALNPVKSPENRTVAAITAAVLASLANALTEGLE